MVGRYCELGLVEFIACKGNPDTLLATGLFYFDRKRLISALYSISGLIILPEQ